MNKMVLYYFIIIIVITFIYSEKEAEVKFFEFEESSEV